MSISLLVILRVGLLLTFESSLTLGFKCLISVWISNDLVFISRHLHVSFGISALSRHLHISFGFVALCHLDFLHALVFLFALRR